MYYLKYFFITSILGFFLETFMCPGYQSGVLYGPWAFIYGIGSLIIIILSDNILKRKNLNKFLRFIILFFSCFLILSFIELLGGLFIEKLFGVSFWDYTKYKYNVGKYICLEVSLLWVIASIFFVFVLRPLIDLFIKKIPNYIFLILIVLFGTDIVFTFIFKVIIR